MLSIMKLNMDDQDEVLKGSEFHQDCTFHLLSNCKHMCHKPRS